MDHLLLTILGVGSQEADYVLGEGAAERSRLAPSALMKLLPEDQRPSRVRALCTSAAKTTGGILQNELSGVTVDLVPIPDGQSQDDVDGFLRVFAEAIPEQTSVTLDITHGFRHFSFLMFVGALYVSALREVEVRAVYYALWKRPDQGVSPFLELKRLLDLSRWIHAIQAFRETGSAAPMAAMLQAEDNQNIKKLRRELLDISRAYTAGLPLELGRAARRFRDQRMQPFEKHLANSQKLPLACEVTERFSGLFEDLILNFGDSSPGWKGRVELDEDELRRQARLIDSLFEREENIPAAAGLLREWVVSWVEYRQNRRTKWIERETRKSAESLLWALEAFEKDKALAVHLSPEQKKLADFWRDLCEMRNSFAHHGMRGEPLSGKRSRVEKHLRSVREYWDKTLKNLPAVDLRFGEKRFRRALVSPLGTTPGVLFSALGTCREADLECDACLVICSQQTKASAAEGFLRAGFEAGEENVKILLFEDPQGGRQEIQRLAAEAKKFLAGAEQVLVNITGGTTLMGLMAERIAGDARSMALPVRRFGLLDRRARQEQLAEPYRQSETLWLDKEAAKDDSDGDD